MRKPAWPLYVDRTTSPTRIPWHAFNVQSPFSAVPLSTRSCPVNVWFVMFVCTILPHGRPTPGPMPIADEKAADLGASS